MTNEVDTLIDKMADDLKSLLQTQSIDDPLLVGIHTGGTWVAQRLHARLQPSRPLGELNISFYRDDFTRAGLNPQVNPTQLPFSVDNEHIVLIDDVLYTGRTIRAAMNELFDYGRPASIILAIMIDRDGRELPVCADIIGNKLKLTDNQQVKLTGPEPLQMSIVQVPA